MSDFITAQTIFYRRKLCFDYFVGRRFLQMIIYLMEIKSPKACNDIQGFILKETKTTLPVA